MSPIRFPEISREEFAKKAEYTPRVIPAGETFHVPSGKQVLFAEEIDVEGDLVIDGDLVEVS